jgi:hypothetical protein
MGRIAWGIVLGVLVLAGPAPLPAQGLAPAQTEAAQIAAPDTSVGAALRNLASRAGVVFVGQVTGIQRQGGVVEVRFSVQRAVLGPVGATYTLREWAGLWAAGQPRYAVGQRAMIFLHAPSAAGLSSPVDGMDGIVPLLPTATNTPPLLDIRRLAARVQRAPGAPLAAADTGGLALVDAVTVVSAWKTAGVEPALRPLPDGARPRPAPARSVYLPPASLRSPLVLGVADAGR